MNKLSETGLKLVKDLKTGRTVKGNEKAQKAKKSMAPLRYAKNPWPDLDTTENQPLLNKVLDNYYK